MVSIVKRFRNESSSSELVSVSFIHSTGEPDECIDWLFEFISNSTQLCQLSLRHLTVTLKFCRFSFHSSQLHSVQVLFSWEKTVWFTKAYFITVQWDIADFPRSIYLRFLIHLAISFLGSLREFTEYFVMFMTDYGS